MASSECPSCHGPSATTVGLGEGRVRVTCATCGFAEVRDVRGRKHLVAETPVIGGRRLLNG